MATLMDYAKDFAIKNGGAIVGGLMGAAASSNSKPVETTATRDPWGAAQPFMVKNLEDEAKLKAYYQANPFSAQQQAGLNNTFADADNFRGKVAPGLLDFANNAMTSSYSRQTGGAPGSGGGYGGLLQPGGRSGGGAGPFRIDPLVSRGYAEGMSTGPMPDGSAMPRMQSNAFGQVDFAKANPFTNGAIPAPKAADPAAAPYSGGLLSGSGGGGSDSGMSGGGGSDGGTWSGGMGVGKATDAINQWAMEVAKQFGLADPVVGVLAGLMSKGYSEWEALQAINATEDPLGAWISAQGHDGGGSSGNGVGGYGGEGYGSGTDGSSGGYGSSYGSGSVGGF